MSDPLITIITPFHDVAAYLAEAIDSVLAQSFDDWELLLVDDGSGDGSAEIATRFAARFPGRIALLRHPGGVNRGISASRNLGLAHARGTWLASLDGDDVWTPTKLAEQVAIVRAHPEVGLVMGASCYWHSWSGAPGVGPDRIVRVGAPQDRVAEPPSLLGLLYPLGQGDAPSMNTVLVRRDVAARVGGWEDRFRTGYEDQAFLGKVYLDTPAYVAGSCWDFYRQRPGSCSATDLVGDRYHAHRRSFLEWYEGYLDRRGLVNGPVWDALERRLEPYRRPVRATIRRLGRGAWRRLAAMAR